MQLIELQMKTETFLRIGSVRGYEWESQGNVGQGHKKGSRIRREGMRGRLWRQKEGESTCGPEEPKMT